MTKTLEKVALYSLLVLQSIKEAELIGWMDEID